MIYRNEAGAGAEMERPRSFARFWNEQVEFGHLAQNSMVHALIRVHSSLDASMLVPPDH